MRAAISQLNSSARANHRILKLARTIADSAEHLAEALHATRQTKANDAAG